MASIRDVAKLAGVSVGTVSRVINQNGPVAPKTIQRVRESIEALHYVPNELARNLYKKQTGIIAVLVPIINHPFFSSFIHQCETELAALGYKMMLCNTSNNFRLETEYLHMLERNIVDGIITGGYCESTQLYSKIQRPIVAFDRFLDENIPIVRSDHALGGRLAAKTLLKCGCKCIVHYGKISNEAVVKSMPFKEKDLIFEQMIREAGVKYIGIENNLDFKNFIKADLFNQYPEIDGFFGADSSALCFLNIALSAKRKVPDDVCIVSYDGTTITQMVTPSITSIVQPLDNISKAAVNTVVNMIAGVNPKEQLITLPVTLRQGGTTKIIDSKL